MVCPFEILHYVPLALIAVAFVAGFRGISKVKLSGFVLVMSIIGLISGNHVHTEHAHAITLLDPCYAYMVLSVISLINMAFKMAKAYKAPILGK